MLSFVQLADVVFLMASSICVSLYENINITNVAHTPFQAWVPACASLIS